MNLNTSNKMSIKGFKQRLVNKNVDIKIVDYVKQELFNIDIPFIDTLMDMVGADECFIPHEMLEKYADYSFSGSNDVLRIFVRYGIIVIQPTYASLWGRTENIEYVLHPDTFKMTLMRTQNTK